MAVKASQELPGARPGNALAGLDQKQGRVGGAFNQAGAVVEKPVGLPFQSDTPVRAAVFVGIDPALTSHDKQV